MHNHGGNGILDGLRKAVDGNDVSELKRLLGSLSEKERAAVFCRPLFDDRPILHYALNSSSRRVNRVDVVKYLLKKSTHDILSHVDKHGDFVPYLALKAGEEYIDAVLGTSLDWSTTVDKDGNTALAKALSCKDEDVAIRKKSLEKAIDAYPSLLYQVNSSNSNVFHSAAESGRIENLLFCVDAVARGEGGKRDLSLMLGHKNIDRATPMNLMSHNLEAEECISIIKKLRDKDGKVQADVFSRDREGSSPIGRLMQLERLEDIEEVCKKDTKCLAEMALYLLEEHLIDHYDRFMLRHKDVRSEIQERCGRELLRNPDRIFSALRNSNTQQGGHNFWEEGRWKELYRDLDSEMNFLSTAVVCDPKKGFGDYIRNLPAGMTKETFMRTVIDKMVCHSQNPSRDFKNLCFAIDLYPLHEKSGTSLVCDGIPSQTLQFIMDNSAAHVLEEICAKISSPRSGRVSLIRETLDSMESVEEIGKLVKSALQNDNSSDASINANSFGRRALKKELSDYAISLVKDGDFGKLRTLIEASPVLVYSEEEKTGKSIIEVASELGYSECVRMLIEEHKKIADITVNGLVQADAGCNAISSVSAVASVSPSEAEGMTKKLLAAGAEISTADAKNIMTRAAPGNKGLYEILHSVRPEIKESEHLFKPKKAVRAVREYKNTSIKKPAPAAEEQSALQDYGLLRKYASTIRDSKGDVRIFKKNVLDEFKNVKDFTRTGGENGTGHSIFTIVATLGTPEQQEMLMSHLKKVKGTFPILDTENISPLGNSLNCAIAARNEVMVKHLLENAKKSDIRAQSGPREENLLHSVLRANRPELLFSINKGKVTSQKSASSDILNALFQSNSEGKSPLDISLSMGSREQNIFFSFLSNSLDSNDVELLLGSSDILSSMIENDAPTSAYEWLFEMERQFNDENRRNGSSKRINVLGSQRHVHKLFTRACKNSHSPGARIFYDAIKDRIERRVRSDVMYSERDDTDINTTGLARTEEGTEKTIDQLTMREVIDLSRRELSALVESNTYNAELYEGLCNDAKFYSYEGVRAIVDSAIFHDNPDLIRHLGIDVERELSPSDLLNKGKDNMLAYVLEKSSTRFRESEECKRIVSRLVDDPSMRNSRDVFREDIQLLYRLRSLHPAIESGNLEDIREVVERNPSLIAKSKVSPEDVLAYQHGKKRILPQKEDLEAIGKLPSEVRSENAFALDMLPYDFALSMRSNNPSHSDVTTFLARKTLEFATELRKVGAQEQQETSIQRLAAGIDDSVFSISRNDRIKLATTVTRALAYHGNDLHLTKEQLNALESYVHLAAENLLENEIRDKGNGILRTALEKGDTEFAKNYLEKYKENILNRYIDGTNPEGASGEPYSLLSDMINHKENGQSILHLAALSGDYSLLEDLIEMGGDPTITTSNGENIVHLCARSGIKTHSGEYAFVEMLRNDPNLGTLDNNNKGVLYHAARCTNPNSARDMLQSIMDDNTLDVNVSRVNPEQRSKYIEGELRRSSAERDDNVIDVFLEKNAQSSKNTGKEKKEGSSLVQNLFRACSNRNSDIDALLDLLVRESNESFSAVNPLEKASPTLSESRASELKSQRTLSMIARSGNITPQNVDKMRSIPSSIFTRRDPVSHLSPIDRAIAAGNVEFLKYYLSDRGSEINPALSDVEGNNLVCKLARFISENPAVVQDREFLNQYASLLETSRCVTKSGNDVTAQFFLEKVANPEGAVLRKAAHNSAVKENELKDSLSAIEEDIREGRNHNIATNRLTSMINSEEKFASVAVNPFGTLFSHVLSDLPSLYGGLSDEHRAYISSFTKNSDIRKFLRSVDENGNNPLQHAIRDLVSSKGTEIGIQKSDLLHEICTDLLERLEREDPELLTDFFLKHRNSDGENLLETIASLNPSNEIFSAIEAKLTPTKISKFSDLNTILARSANQSAIQNHVCKRYSVFPIGNSDIYGNIRIHKAALSGNVSAFNSVMMSGGNINQLDSSGNTTLHVLLNHMVNNEKGINEGHLEILKTLVSRGAPLHCENSEGLTPCDLAKVLNGSAFGRTNSCLRLIADSRMEYHGLKNKVRKEIESKYVVGTKRSEAIKSNDISGSTLDIKVGKSGVLRVSSMLCGDLCKNNNFSSISLDFNEGKDKGRVDKVGSKRNYTAMKGELKLDLSWRPHGSGTKQKVSVVIDAEGNISVHPSSKGVAPNGENLDFSNCRVYIGGIPLRQALLKGRWKEQAASIGSPSEEQDLSRELERSPENTDGPSPSRRNSIEDSDDLNMSTDSDEQEVDETATTGRGEHLRSASISEETVPLNVALTEAIPSRAVPPVENHNTGNTEESKSEDINQTEVKVPVSQDAPVTESSFATSNLAEDDASVASDDASSDSLSSSEDSEKEIDSLDAALLKIVKGYGVANSTYGFHSPEDSPIISAAKSVSSALQDLLKNIPDPKLRRSPMNKAIQNAFEDNDIQYKEIGDKVLEITQGQITNHDVPEHFSSPYGFGKSVDRMIDNSLSDLKEISARSRLECNIKVKAKHLPLLARAVNNILVRPVSQGSNLGVGEAKPIQPDEAERMFKAITNMCMLYDKAIIKPLDPDTEFSYSPNDFRKAGPLSEKDSQLLSDTISKILRSEEKTKKKVKKDKQSLETTSSQNAAPAVTSETITNAAMEVDAIEEVPDSSLASYVSALGGDSDVQSASPAVTSENSTSDTMEVEDFSSLESYVSALEDDSTLQSASPAVASETSENDAMEIGSSSSQNDASVSGDPALQSASPAVASETSENDAMEIGSSSPQNAASVSGGPALQSATPENSTNDAMEIGNSSPESAASVYGDPALQSATPAVAPEASTNDAMEIGSSSPESAASVSESDPTLQHATTTSSTSKARGSGDATSASERNKDRGVKNIKSEFNVLSAHRDLNTTNYKDTGELLETANEMRKELKNPGDIEVFNFAMLRALCRKADLSFALNNVKRENLDNAVKELLSECNDKAKEFGAQGRDSHNSLRLDASIHDMLKSSIPEVLSKNGITYKDIGNPVFRVIDGTIRCDQQLPQGYSSPTGLGKPMEDTICLAVQAIGEIVHRSNGALSNYLALPLETLPQLVNSVLIAQDDCKKMNIPVLGAGNGASLMSRGEGKVLLNHINNSVLLKGGEARLKELDKEKAISDLKLKVLGAAKKDGITGGTTSPGSKEHAIDGMASAKSSSVVQEAVKICSMGMKDVTISADSSDLPKNAAADLPLQDAPVQREGKGNTGHGR